MKMQPFEAVGSPIGINVRRSIINAAISGGMAEGQHRYWRQNADQCRIIRARRQTSEAGFDRCRESARGRRGYSRQNESLGVGKLPLVRIDQRLVRSRRSD